MTAYHHFYCQLQCHFNDNFNATSTPLQRQLQCHSNAASTSTSTRCLNRWLTTLKCTEQNNLSGNDVEVLGTVSCLFIFLTRYPIGSLSMVGGSVASLWVLSHLQWSYGSFTDAVLSRGWFNTLSLCGRVSVCFCFCTVSLCSGKPAGIEFEGGFCYNSYLFIGMPQVRNLQNDLSLSVSAFWNCSCSKASVCQACRLSETCGSWQLGWREADNQMRAGEQPGRINEFCLRRTGLERQWIKTRLVQCRSGRW